MPTLQITLTVPEGTTVEIDALEGAGTAAPSVTSDEAVLRYWRALSNNGRKLYGAAARIEQVQGTGYTFEDIGSNLNITHSSVLAVYRNVCRTANAWMSDSGESEPPIRLVEIDYPETLTGGGRRTRYQLPPGVANLIADLPLVYGKEGEE
jgi:hypothetical protein